MRSIVLTGLAVAGGTTMINRKDIDSYEGLTRPGGFKPWVIVWSTDR